MNNLIYLSLNFDLKIAMKCKDKLTLILDYVDYTELPTQMYIILRVCKDGLSVLTAILESVIFISCLSHIKCDI